MMPSLRESIRKLGLMRKRPTDSICKCSGKAKKARLRVHAESALHPRGDVEACWRMGIWDRQLTLNTTSINIPRLLKLGFVERIPLRLTGPRLRRVLVAPEIDAMLNTNTPYFPRASAEALITSFCAGHMVSVSRRMEVSADLKRMVGPDEVWTMCFRRPRPGGRMLGRFLERDVFVGMGLYLREDLAGAAYAEKARIIVDSWAERTEGLPYLGSAALSDYLGHVYMDRDQED